ncbi:unnamed protein product [Acanthosepion pharaonis]|uniref:Transmembrane protein n=1 Tax=Acanthosepion pharaonis TaxID=158019 RepID=A0A812DNS4_ACAPH|nr:unnamed protein product [Sepia pharaonis]
MLSSRHFLDRYTTDICNSTLLTNDASLILKVSRIYSFLFIYLFTLSYCHLFTHSLSTFFSFLFFSLFSFFLSFFLSFFPIVSVYFPSLSLTLSTTFCFFNNQKESIALFLSVSLSQTSFSEYLFQSKHLLSYPPLSLSDLFFSPLLLPTQLPCHHSHTFFLSFYLSFFLSFFLLSFLIFHSCQIYFPSLSLSITFSFLSLTIILKAFHSLQLILFNPLQKLSFFFSLSQDQTLYVPDMNPPISLCISFSISLLQVFLTLSIFKFSFL